MNQILYTGKNNSHGPASLKSILRFFSICLIVLGVIFLGKGSYALYQNNNIRKAAIDNTIPNISFEQDGNNAVITVSHNKGISKVKYHWNDDVDTIIQANSEPTVILDNINIKSGTNTLYVTAIDVNNKVAETSHLYSYEGISIEFGDIDSTTSSIQVISSDVKGLSYVKYKWNNGEEITAYPSAEDPTKIVVSPQVLEGLNTLSVTAVNTENKTLTMTKELKGVYPPKIQLFIQDGYLYVIVTDTEGLSKITQQINVEEPLEINLNGEKEKAYKYPIGDRDNILVTITAIDVEGVTSTFKGKNY